MLVLAYDLSQAFLLFYQLAWVLKDKVLTCYGNSICTVRFSMFLVQILYLIFPMNNDYSVSKFEDGFASVVMITLFMAQITFVVFLFYLFACR